MPETGSNRHSGMIHIQYFNSLLVCKDFFLRDLFQTGAGFYELMSIFTSDSKIRFLNGKTFLCHVFLNVFLFFFSYLYVYILLSCWYLYKCFDSSSFLPRPSFFSNFYFNPFSKIFSHFSLIFRYFFSYF